MREGKGRNPCELGQGRTGAIEMVLLRGVDFKTCVILTATRFVIFNDALGYLSTPDEKNPPFLRSGPRWHYLMCLCFGCDQSDLLGCNTSDGQEVRRLDD